MSFRNICVRILFGVFIVNIVSYGQVYYKVIPGAIGADGKIMITQDVTWIGNHSVCPPASTSCTVIDFNANDKFAEYLLACLNKMDGTVITFQVVGDHYKFLYHPSTSLHHCLWELEFFKDATGINIEITTVSESAAGKTGTILLSPTATRQEQLKVDYLVSLLLEVIPNYKNEYWLFKELCFTINGSLFITEMYAGPGLNDMPCSP